MIDNIKPKRKYIRKSRRVGLDPVKIKANKKRYYTKHKEERKEYSRQWRIANPDKVKRSNKKHQRTKLESKEYYNENKEIFKTSTKKYRTKNKDKIRNQTREYARKRRTTDINYKLTTSLRARLNSAIRGNFKNGSAVRDLGCSIPEFKKYIESLFELGMTWDNWGEWHLDHKKPLNTFNLSNREQLLEACHFTNLRPLWKFDNLGRPHDGSDLINNNNKDI